MLTSTTALPAQSAPIDLGVQGTAAYNWTWNANAASPDGLRASVARFSGRVAIRATQRLFVGVGVSSWQYESGSVGVRPSFPLDTAAGLTTAVIYSSFAQFYPMRTVQAFVRVGTGIASTRRYVPDVFGIDDLAATHIAVTSGLGLDVPLRPHVALTMSGDFTTLLGREVNGDAKSGLLMGLGLTIR
jgi:hypothetical protein